MIKRFGDYDKTQTYGDNKLPKGGYILKVLAVDNKSGNYGDYLVINYDIAEGQFKDFYLKDYISIMSSNQVKNGGTGMVIMFI